MSARHRRAPHGGHARAEASPEGRSNAAAPPPGERPRFLSEADCRDVAQRLARFAVGGGLTTVAIVSHWTANVRWARNQISTSGEARDNHVVALRTIRGSESPWLIVNEVTDEALVAVARRAERLTDMQPEILDADLAASQEESLPILSPSLFSETTYQQDAGERAAVAHGLIQSATAAGMLSAGYIAVSARSIAFLTSAGLTRYFAYTWARYSVTVRDPRGTGSGWAGVDWPDWSKIDGPALSARALEKCLASRNPVAIEPGRYTTILEPQAVADFVGPLVWGQFRDGGDDAEEGLLTRKANEVWKTLPFNQGQIEQEGHLLGLSRLGQKVMDERISISTDPMDPELGYPPFTPMWWGAMPPAEGEIFAPAHWIEHGVLNQLAYGRFYALDALGRPRALPNPRTFRMQVSGTTSSLQEMIANTTRGLLVTRFDKVEELTVASTLVRGYTRDGLWLIEKGTISKPVKNMVFTESILSSLNSVEQLGIPQRVFHPHDDDWMFQPQPAIVPALKIRDFSFTALADAI